MEFRIVKLELGIETNRKEPKRTNRILNSKF
jgi:hypothetical protein